MKALSAFLILFAVANILHSQQVQLDFTPAYDNFQPFINSYSPSDGLKQFYVKDAKWVRNNSIPAFTDADKFESLSLQYIKGDDVTVPQLFVYSQKKQVTFHFTFFLIKNGN